MANLDLQGKLNELAGTVGLEAQGAANKLAGTTNVDLVKCLNTLAGTTGLEFNGAVKAYAALIGGNPSLDSGDALDPSSTWVNESVAYWKAKLYSGTGDLLDQTGKGRHARLGSTTGADTNDPLFLPFSGEKYAYFPGTNGNYMSIPDSAALSITGDIEIWVKAAMDDWTPAAANELVGKRPTVAVGYEYSFRLAGTGLPELLWHNGSGFVQPGQAAIQVPTPDGQETWIGVTRSIEGVDYAIRYYTAPVSVGTPTIANATQLGIGRLISIVGNSPVDSVEPLYIGASRAGTADWAKGKIKRVLIRNGLNGATALDVDLSFAVEPFSTLVERSANAAVATFNRSASGLRIAVVDRPMFLFGTDDYMEVANHADLNFGATDNFTVMVAVRTYGMAASARYIDKRGTVGWLVNASSSLVPQSYLQDPAALNSVDAAPSLAAGAASTIALVVARPNNEVFTNGTTNGATSMVTIGDLTSTSVLRIGAAPANFGYGDFEFIAGAIVRRALTSSEISSLAADLLA